MNMTYGAKMISTLPRMNECPKMNTPHSKGWNFHFEATIGNFRGYNMLASLGCTSNRSFNDDTYPINIWMRLIKMRMNGLYTFLGCINLDSLVSWGYKFSNHQCLGFRFWAQFFTPKAVTG